jgi:hypothetical protein
MGYTNLTKENFQMAHLALQKRKPSKITLRDLVSAIATAIGILVALYYMAKEVEEIQ